MMTDGTGAPLVPMPWDQEDLEVVARPKRRPVQRNGGMAPVASIDDDIPWDDGEPREAEPPGASLTLAGDGIDAADLLELDLPPLRWIVPDLLPEGTTVLAAPPKVGKSCLVYQIAVEVAIGGDLFGRRVTPGSVLYLALEDGQRRGQDRLRAALDGRTMPRGRLEVRWGARCIGEGLEEDLVSWLDAHPDAVLVALDTMQRVRPGSDGRRNAYEVDVEHLGRLQQLFRDRRVALVIVHHANKAGSDDFLASVSGTYGITGSADTIIVIRRKRLETFGTLLVTGRDVPDAELPARFDGMTWHEAPASLPAASFERAEVYRVIASSGPIFPAAIAAQLGLGRTSVQNMVTRLVTDGAVVRTPKGYGAAAPEPGLARAGVPTDYHDSSDRRESHSSHRGHARARGGRVRREERNRRGPIRAQHRRGRVMTRERIDVPTCVACYRARALSELIRVLEVRPPHRTFYVCRPSTDSRCFRDGVNNVWVHRIEAATPRSERGGRGLVDVPHSPPFTRRLHKREVPDEAVQRVREAP